MSYLVQINERTGEILHPEILKLSDTFHLLTEKEMLYVVLFTDYNSLYAQFPEHDRKRRAMWHAFKENESEIIETDRIRMAIEEYMSFQYDADREQIRVFQKKIDLMNEELIIDNSKTSIKNTLDAIRSLKDNILSLQNKVSEKAKADGVVKGDRQLSLLEKVITNKKLYKSVTKPR